MNTFFVFSTTEDGIISVYMAFCMESLEFLFSCVALRLHIIEMENLIDSYTIRISNGLCVLKQVNDLIVLANFIYESFTT